MGRLERVRLSGAAPSGRRAIRDLADRHGIRPTKALGQNFLVDPNLARAIAASVGAAPGVRVLEVGAGLGSLTVALAEAGADVLALEFDRNLIPALGEVLAGLPEGRVRLEVGDAMRADWAALLGSGDWRMASNLPYNVAVPLVLDLLATAPGISRYVVMVQREVADRLVAAPDADAYGAVSVKVAYHADASLLRAVPPTVFWPEPKVGSALVALTPHAPRVSTPRAALFRVVDEGFAQRRKTMGNALRRLGLDAADAIATLAACGVATTARAETLDVAAFSRIADALLARGVDLGDAA
ncbi:MAG: 16S rRNA (adenine(1518)-N(6)/adenine(1519)-N(6))-dimethyltransferase RsmA [Actinomycetota bacterium]